MNPSAVAVPGRLLNNEAGPSNTPGVAARGKIDDGNPAMQAQNYCATTVL